jgi:large subunit ribosomal protein L2
MKLKKNVNYTNAVRHQINIEKNTLSKYNNILKNLLLQRISFAGRNSTGRITVRHKGAGCKKKVHLLTYFKHFYAIVLNTMYNPRTNAFVTLNFDIARRHFFKTISINCVNTGCLLQSNTVLNDYKLGYKAPLSVLPTGTIISCITNRYGKVLYARSGGSYCQLLERGSNCIKIKLPSGNQIYLSNKTYGTLGPIGNSSHKLTVIGKAGRNRLIGIRPCVRGVAMNPVDHPHGGKSNKGMPQVTPWGLPTKNKPTVKKNKYE